jgi:hypothetical protein
VSDFLGKLHAILACIRLIPKAGTVIAIGDSALQVSAFLFEQPTFLIGVIA